MLPSFFLLTLLASAYSSNTYYIGSYADHTGYIFWSNESGLYQQSHTVDTLFGLTALVPSAVIGDIVSLPTAIILTYRVLAVWYQRINYIDGSYTVRVRDDIVADSISTTHHNNNTWHTVWSDNTTIYYSLQSLNSTQENVGVLLNETDMEALSIDSNNGNFFLSYTANNNHYLHVWNADNVTGAPSFTTNLRIGTVLQPRITSINEYEIVAWWQNSNLYCSRRYNLSEIINPNDAPFCAEYQKVQALNLEQRYMLVYLENNDLKLVTYDPFTTQTLASNVTSFTITVSEPYLHILRTDNNLITITQHGIGMLTSSDSTDNQASLSSQPTQGFPDSGDNSMSAQAFSDSGDTQEFLSPNPAETSSSPKPAETASQPITNQVTRVSPAPQTTIMNVNVVIEVHVVYTTDFGWYEVTSWPDANSPGVIMLNFDEDYLPGEDITLFTWAANSPMPDFIIEGETECVFLDGETYSVKKRETTDNSYVIGFEPDDCGVDSSHLLKSFLLVSAMV